MVRIFGKELWRMCLTRPALAHVCVWEYELGNGFPLQSDLSDPLYSMPPSNGILPIRRISVNEYVLFAATEVQQLKFL